MNKIYAGIGSRETPEGICLLMGDIAAYLGKKGFMLRSGDAVGADRSFEFGASCGKNYPTEIFEAKDCTEKAMELSSKFHPNWNACSPYAKKLHGRNAMILLGKELNKNADFIVCWTKDGAVVGGTGQALRMAKHYKIPIFNLFFNEVRSKFIDKLSK